MIGCPGPGTGVDPLIVVDNDAGGDAGDCVVGLGTADDAADEPAPAEAGLDPVGAVGTAAQPATTNDSATASRETFMSR